MNEPQTIAVIMFLFATLVGAIAWLFGFDSGRDNGKADTEAKAVEDGAGEYYLDEDHKRQFRWKVNR